MNSFSGLWEMQSGAAKCTFYPLKQNKWHVALHPKSLHICSWAVFQVNSQNVLTCSGSESTQSRESPVGGAVMCFYGNHQGPSLTWSLCQVVPWAWVGEPPEFSSYQSSLWTDYKYQLGSNPGSTVWVWGHEARTGRTPIKSMLMSSLSLWATGTHTSERHIVGV